MSVCWVSLKGEAMTEKEFQASVLKIARRQGH